MIMCSGAEIPANLRMLLKSVSSKTPDNNLIKEDSFRRDEINALKKAVINSKNRVNSLSEDQVGNLSKILAEVKMKPKNELLTIDGMTGSAERHESRINSLISPTIQYKDYETLSNGYEDLKKKSPIINSHDPNYSMATTIGRAKYKPDENGNLHVTDVYNFNDSKNSKRLSFFERLKELTPSIGGEVSYPYRVARTIAPLYSKPLNMDIQLQHGSNGGW